MTIVDPFAAPALEEAQQHAPAPAPSPWTSAPAAETPTAPAAVASSNSEVVLTFKGGTGFDAPWIVIHAEDLESAHRAVSDEAALLADLMSRVQKAGSHFASTAPAKAAGSPNTAARSNAPQGATEPPAGAPASPGDGWVFKSGVSKKTGKAWKAWMPPQGRDDLSPKFFD